MARNYNQAKKYQASFGKGNFKPQTWEFRMGEHPTQYGNGSSVAVFINDAFQGMCDTRYDREIMNDFGKWCEEYLAGYFDPAYEPSWVEI
jgi:hypothetical protein